MDSFKMLVAKSAIGPTVVILLTVVAASCGQASSSKGEEKPSRLAQSVEVVQMSTGDVCYVLWNSGNIAISCVSHK